MDGLATILLGLGGKALSALIARKFGDDMGQLTQQAINALATAFGTAPEPEAIEKRISEVKAADPEKAEGLVRWAEGAVAPQLLEQAAVWREANEQQRMTNELLAAELKDGGPAGAWLWIWQYFLMFVWGWALILVHLVNAVLRLIGGTQLPAVDLTILMTLTGAYLALHMGGHTVLELMRGGVFRRGEKA